MGSWELDEPADSTTVRDNSGSAKNATVGTGVTLGAPGRFGTAAYFNGTSSGLITGSDAALPEGSAARTLQVWINPASLKNQRGIFYYGTGTTEKAFGFYYQSGPFSITGWGDDYGVSDALPVNAWTHTIRSFDGSTARIYANGVLAGSSSSPAWNTILGKFSFGTDLIGGAPVNGLLDEVAGWNRVLCDGTNICATSKIYELYRRGANRLKYQVRSCSDSSCTTGSPPWVGTDGTSQTYCFELNNKLIPNDGGDLTFSDSVNTGLPTMSFSSFPSLTASVIPTNRYFQYRAIFETTDAVGSCTYGGVSELTCSLELKSVAVGPNHYDISAPTLISNQGVPFYTLSWFLQTVASGGCASGVLYNLGTSNTGPWMYWNGSAWAAISRPLALQARSAIRRSFNPQAAHAG